jgi:glycosyltransferase involved in cell wall biosynthesis
MGPSACRAPCARSLATPRVERVECIVVDSGSSDGSWQDVSAHWDRARVLRSLCGLHLPHREPARHEAPLTVPAIVQAPKLVRAGVRFFQRAVVVDRRRLPGWPPGEAGTLSGRSEMAETLATSSRLSLDSRLLGLKRLAIVPALNEEKTVASVIDEIRAFDPGLKVVVVDDGSQDATARIAKAGGATVLRLPFNVGIGGAVQTGFQYALEHGFDVVVQLDGDGQHDPRELGAILAPVVAGEADIVVGSRFSGVGSYRAPLSRRLGIRLFARVVSLIARQPLTDTSSSFRAVNRRGIRLFANEYPHAFLETVEATVLATKCGLRLAEVPVSVRARFSGSSSLTLSRSIWYSLSALVAVFVGLFRRHEFELEEDE